jgi:hypothetical protein
MGGELHALGFVFLLGVPLQILEILWTFFRTLLRREKKANMGNANIAEEKK